MTARRATKKKAAGKAAKSKRRAKSSAGKAAGRARTARAAGKKKGAAKAGRKVARKAPPKAARKTARAASSRPAARSRRGGRKSSSVKRPQAAPERPRPRPKRVNAIPPGYHSVTPYLIVRGAAAAIEYYRSVFGAEELQRMADPAGRIGHAEIRIGDSVVMLADEFPEMNFKGPKTLGGTTGSILLYVPDVDAVFARALEAGATQMRAVEDQFYGDRSGTLEDPFGHRWTIATHQEDVSTEELNARFETQQASQSGG